MPPEMAQCPTCGRYRPLNEMPACRGGCGRRLCGDCLDRKDTCPKCAIHSKYAAHAFAPRDPLAGVPDPDLLRGEVARAAGWLQCVPDLIRLADDLACWSETLDLDSCDAADILADIEPLGTRANDIMGRLRRGGGLLVIERLPAPVPANEMSVTDHPGWVSARRIATALGTSPRVILARARRERWPYRETDTPEPGAMGRRPRLFDVSALPAGVRQRLAASPAVRLDAAAPELLERLEDSTVELINYRDALRAEAEVAGGDPLAADQARELSGVIDANIAVIARIREGESP